MNVQKVQTLYSCRWYSETYGQMVAHINLDLVQEAFEARQGSYYLGHFLTMDLAIAAVRRSFQNTPYVEVV